MEAYAFGEHLAPVTTLSVEKRRRVAAYVTSLNQLQDYLQAHDYISAKEMSARLKAAAKDFPAPEVDTSITHSTRAADLAIEDAKALLSAREVEKAAEKIRAATKLWPTNPKLNAFSPQVAPRE